MENNGYEFEGADASFELLVRKALGIYKKQFFIKSAKTLVEKVSENEEPVSEATVEVQVDGVTEKTSATGNGPVNAMNIYCCIREKERVEFIF